MSKKTLGLGKGFSGKGVEALITSFNKDNNEKKYKDGATVSKDYEVVEIDVNKLFVNIYQPRKEFDKDKLEELKTSILKYGLLEPIIVKETNDGYEIVAGERRTRACKLAGWKTIPAIVIPINSNAEQLEIALIENIQRQDLNPIEIAQAYQRLVKEFNYTQEQLAIKVGKERTTVTNFIRLLKLPEIVQKMVLENKISMGHARSLLMLQDNLQIIAIANEIVEKELSVRATEHIIKKISEDTKQTKTKKISKKEYIIDTDVELMLQEIQKNLREKLGTNVKILVKNKETGNINIEFYSFEDLERLYNIIK